MKVKNIENQKFYIVPYMDNNLYISRQGICFDNNTNEIIKPIINRNDIFIKYKEIIYSVAQLIALTFIGRHDGPIKFNDNNHKNCTSKNVTYKYKLTYLTSEKCIIDDEEFKPIPNTNGQYYINQYGAIFNISYGFLHCTISKGYYRTNINCESDISTEVNRLVYISYKGLIPEGYVVDHVDGNSWHNEPYNLEAVTIAENVRRGYDNQNYGRSRVWSKDQIQELCKMMEAGYDIYQISESFNIPNDKRNNLVDIISKIRNKGYHSDISSKYDISNFVINRERMDNRTSDYNQIKQIVKMIRDGFSDTVISKELNIPRIKIYQIRSGKVYKSFVNKANEELDNE